MTASGDLVVVAHQPNLLPRLHTLLKVVLSDVLFVLDDVQFSQREWQNRARVLPYGAEAGKWFWLSLPVRLPSGRETKINECQLVDGGAALARAERTLVQAYSRSPWWDELAPAVVGPMAAREASFADVATESLVAAARLMGWRGRVVLSSQTESSTDRVGRLVDLTRTVGGGIYLCGRGGRSYMDAAPFADVGIGVAVMELEHEGLIEGLPASLAWVSYAARVGVPDMLATVRGATWMRPL